MNYLEAYILGCIASWQSNIPENKIIVLFGDSASGKSYLIRLVADLKNKTLDEIKTEMKDDELSDEEAKSIKELVDNIIIVPKKTTRPPRENEKQSKKVEILEGLSEEEVNACDITYEYGGNLYGLSIGEIDEALKQENVLMIVNDADAISNLKAIYKEKLKPILVYRVNTQGDWSEIMKISERSQDEIIKRANSLNVTKKIYNIIRMVNLDVIVNFPGAKGNKKALLKRLEINLGDRTDNNKDRN